MICLEPQISRVFTYNSKCFYGIFRYIQQIFSLLSCLNFQHSRAGLCSQFQIGFGVQDGISWFSFVSFWCFFFPFSAKICDVSFFDRNKQSFRWRRKLTCRRSLRNTRRDETGQISEGARKRTHRPCDSPKRVQRCRRQQFVYRPCDPVSAVWLKVEASVQVRKSCLCSIFPGFPWPVQCFALFVDCDCCEKTVRFVPSRMYTQYHNLFCVSGHRCLSDAIRRSVFHVWVAAATELVVRDYCCGIL